MAREEVRATHTPPDDLASHPLRRLSPEAGRIALDKLSADEESELFYQMGWELGNVHLGSPHAIDNVRRDLHERPHGWLLKAALMIKQVSDEEHKTWKSHWETNLASKERAAASTVQPTELSDVVSNDSTAPAPVRANL